MRTHLHRPVAAILSLALAMAAGCASVKVDSDYDPGTDFASLKTWSWVADPPQLEGGVRVQGNQLLKNRVTSAVERTLSSQGYPEAQGSPDFRVAFSFGAQQKLDVQSSPSAGGYYGGRGRGGVYSGWGGSTVDVQQYTEGTLIIDILRPDGQNLLWRGTGTTRLREEKDPQKRTEKVNAAVEKILAQFPPGKK